MGGGRYSNQNADQEEMPASCQYESTTDQRQNNRVSCCLRGRQVNASCKNGKRDTNRICQHLESHFFRLMWRNLKLWSKCQDLPDEKNQFHLTLVYHFDIKMTLYSFQVHMQFETFEEYCAKCCYFNRILDIDSQVRTVIPQKLIDCAGNIAVFGNL